MFCPKCDTEMRIKGSEYVLNDGKLFSKQVLTCRNKNCSNFDKDVKVIYTPLAVTEDSEATEETPS